MKRSRTHLCLIGSFLAGCILSSSMLFSQEPAPGGPLARLDFPNDDRVMIDDGEFLNDPNMDDFGNADRIAPAVRPGFVPPGGVVPRLGFDGQLLFGRGMLVRRVYFGSIAERMGLEQGDLIIAVNGTRIRTDADWRTSLLRSGGRVVLDVRDVRTGNIVRLSARLNNGAGPVQPRMSPANPNNPRNPRMDNERPGIRPGSEDFGPAALRDRDRSSTELEGVPLRTDLSRNSNRF